MPVVSTGMHATGMAGTVFECIRLVHWQSVHICPKANARAASLRQRTDNTGLREASIDLNSPTLQALGYQSGRTLFPVGELWMRVNVPPPTNQVIFVGFDFCRDSHHGPLS